MKTATILISAFLAFFVSTISISQGPPPTNNRKIQIAILFDTSGSMDGLIEQAKSTIWSVVNTASQMKTNGETPQLEISLYDYGNDEIKTKNWIRMRTNLITDLDSISEQLFSLSTNGGSEYCAAVIESALNELNWSTDPQDLKIIYIAGNEPFNQGPIDYKKVLEEAAKRNIVVNTIYCGPYEMGVRELWYDAVKYGQGAYFNIDSNREIVQINTPYDEEIRKYNDSINSTYIGYGRQGMYRMEKQAKEDLNANAKGASVAADRYEAKSKSNYKNSSWDLVDGLEEGTVQLENIKQEDLPNELKGKSKEEIEKYIADKQKQRAAYQNKMNDLSSKRRVYIEEEKKKMVESDQTKDLGAAIKESLVTNALKNGYTIE